MAVTTLRARAVAFAAPHFIGTLGFAVKDARRDEFATRAGVRRIPHLRLGVPAAAYYVDLLQRELPQAEIEMIATPREFFAKRGEELDAYAFPAELGAAWTLLYPEYSVVVPKPGLVAVPLAWSAAAGDLETAAFLGTWLELKRANGTLGHLRDRWVLGRDPRARPPRWSVLHDVLGWHGSLF